MICLCARRVHVVMNAQSHLGFLALALGLGVMACSVATENTDSSQGAATTGPEHHHTFVVQTKGFIAPITGDTLGSLPGSFLTPGFVKNAALYAFSAATNLTFSENPPDGTQESGQYRLWAQVHVDVRCTGSSIVLTVPETHTDAGYEGPLRAGYDPLVTLSSRAGEFYFQAKGRPHVAAEPPFQAIQRRDTNTIWYTVRGRVTCDAQGDATLRIADGDVVTTTFPSFRLWTSKSTDDGAVATNLSIDRAQGNFSDLWYLPEPAESPGDLNPNAFIPKLVSAGSVAMLGLNDAPEGDELPGDPREFCTAILTEAQSLDETDACVALVTKSAAELPALTSAPITF